MLRRRRLVLGGLAAVVVAAVLLWASRDQGHLRPSKPEMERRAGVSLADPVYTSSSRLAALGRRAKVWWAYWTLPIPNQMAMRPPLNTWTYAFRAPASYHPPAVPEPGCVRGGGQLFCDSAEDGWSYQIWFEPGVGEGRLVAQPIE